MTKDQLISAREIFNNDSYKMRNEYLDAYNTIRTLIDEAISKMETVEQTSNSRGLDLESLKKNESPPKLKDALYNDGWNSAIDHLAPRIVRDGMVVVPKEPTEEMIEAWDAWNSTPFNECEDDATGYKAMISAAQKGGE